MFTKLTKSGGHTYVQLVESFRDENGRPRQRTVSTLGRLDEVGGQVDTLPTLPDGHPNSPTYGHLKLPHLS